MAAAAVAVPAFVLTAPRPAQAETAAGPAQTVEALAAELGDLASRASDMDAKSRLDAVSVLIGRYFDLPQIALHTIGVRRYRTLTAEQQAAFEAAFARFTVASYTKRLPEFDAAGFELIGQREGPGKLVTVRARYTGSDGQGRPDASVLDFVLSPASGGEGQDWGVVDLRINGAVSELAMRRSEVATVMAERGFDGLMALLEERIAAMTAQS
jgi:phospholipid transport system substrate-binding protein